MRRRNMTINHNVKLTFRIVKNLVMRAAKRTAAAAMPASALPGRA